MSRPRPWSLVILLVTAGPLLPLLPPLVQPAQAHRAPASEVANPEIRVLLLEGPQLRLRAPQGAVLRRADASAGGSLQRWQPGSDLILTVRDGQWQLQPAPSATPSVTPSASPVREQAALPADLADLWLEPPPEVQGAELVVGERRFRGRLRLMVQDGTLRAVNHVRLEDYLPSVVGSEMPASWPQSALRAQAVVARTYALRQRRPSQPFDLQASVASQVYRGLEAETASTREAVEATRGLVLTFGGSLIQAVFHSSSGGSTANSGEVWAEQLPYLVQVPDFDEHSPVREWREYLSLERLRQTFPEIGGVSGIRVLSTSSGGRLQRVLLEGPLGQVLLSGAQLRARLGLRSTWVRFEPQPLAESASLAELPLPLAAPMPPSATSLSLPPATSLSLPSGSTSADPDEAMALPPAASPQPLDRPWLVIGRGFGHGVGMSQWGAHGLALRGLDFGPILRHYYPGTELRALGGSGTDAVAVGLAAGRP